MTSVALNDNRDNDRVTIGAFFTSYKFRATLITIAIHAAIIIFLWLFYIYTPIPPFPPAPNTPELEVDLAGGGGGSAGDQGASSSENKVTPAEEKATQVPTTVHAANQPTVTNDVEPTTPMPSENAVKVPKKIDTIPKPQQPSVELVSIENKFKNAKASGGGSAQGTGGSGNGLGQGTGTGTGSGSGSGSGKGAGEGEGFGYDLKGRGILKRPELNTNNPEQGKIVVGITVDQDGNVVEATPGMVGSTITDASLYILVKNAALKMKFTKSPDDSPEQSGTVTFRFTIR